MTRTTKEIFIRGTSLEDSKQAVLNWFRKNKFKIMINDIDYVLGRWGRGILTGSKFIDVTLVPAGGGVVAKTEGWVTGIVGGVGWFMYMPETDFDAASTFQGGIPRSEGLKAIKRLWDTLEALSRNP